MTKYNTLLFDLDGTLTDPKVGITSCVQYSLTKLGYKAPSCEELLWFIGPPLRNSYAAYLNTEDIDLVEQAVYYYRERFSTIGMYENEIYPGVKDMLAKLRGEEYKIVLATSKPQSFAKEILRHFAIDSFFDLVVGSNMDGSMCDKTEIIAFIKSKFPTINKNKMIMIGDRNFDINGAKGNDIDSIGVTYGYGSLEEIKAAEPNYIADSIKSLTNIIINIK